VVIGIDIGQARREQIDRPELLPWRRPGTL
jgi:hypothetical protein